MKCPDCGFEIPEGHMYCDNCGNEIKIVPDFEPEVENEIDATLLGVADELNKSDTGKIQYNRRKTDRESELVTFLRTKWKALTALAVLSVLLIAGLVVFISFNSKNALYYLSLADNARSNGNMEQAIGYLREGNQKNPGSSDIIFRLSDYYMEYGQPGKAAEALLLITDSGKFSEEKVLNAYESMISIYSQSGDYEAIAKLLEDSDETVTASLKAKYVPGQPVMTPASGTYDTVTVSLSLSDDSDDPIYYTVNDGTPDSSSIRYENEILLDADGEYNIKAVSVNAFGVSSTVSENTYVIEKGAPSAPEIMEQSGEYNQNTMIVAVVEAGTTIFYTTDGTDPTMESKQYISPITMPVGTSHFKFIAYDAEGNFSEITEREYHLVYTRLVSTEQAVSNLVSTLVRLGLLLDSSGKAIGQEGHNEYIYNSVIEIQGAGEYYVVVENHVNNDGSSAPTGLMYAINTHDGSVNRLGYDSSGKYTLITISNR
ncbi:MAG: chitobiase/beta-hexosaminidase C-terminal domain-containing protein [Butyrivibrio sp.]|nr:chitobiase/beta-hexosaminidase C-terminal domain-containing protein [Butyrivibrio sp.]